MLKTLYFFIGTEAELMKMFHVINEARSRSYDCRIISSGQNDIKNSPYLEKVGGVIDVDLTEMMPEKKTAWNYLSWFIKTEKLGIKVMKEIRDKCDGKLIMIVHGDTLSTLMGARIAQKCKIEHMHVESGLRSHNWLSPFPEEIDRYFSSKKSVINFCQKERRLSMRRKHLEESSKHGIQYRNRDSFDALYEIEKKQMKSPTNGKYFLTAIHRQENLMSRKFMKNTFEKIFDLSESMKCVFIYHVQTESALKKFGLWERFEECENIIKLPRQNYVSFINYVINSEFVMADGCGNQQEFFYLGQPYLIMRTAVEKKSEGLGENAFCFKGDYSKIDEFVSKYHEYKRDRVCPERMPSKIIVDEIDLYFGR